MDYLANYTLIPLRLAGNQLIQNVDSPDGVTNRAPLLYRLDIYKPKAYQSGTFVVHESLRGREAPAYIEGGITLSEGCNFDLSEFVWGLLKATPPKADQDTITVQALATMPYYFKSWVEPYQSTTETTSGIEYLLRAKLNENQFAAWKENFFSTYLQERRGFLTWQPNNKTVDRNQPEFLSYLVHHNPAPTALKVRVEIEYTDGTRSETLTPITLSNVDNFSLYTVPVGFEALGLDVIEEETEKEIFAYSVWLSNQSTQRLSEIRRYVVCNDYEPYVRHIVFLNSLCGWDTLRLYGVSRQQLQMSSTTFQRQLEANYTPSSDELFITNITGERRLTVNTGYQPNREWLEYLEEIFWSENVFVNSNEGFIPLVLGQNTFEGPDDEENFGGRTFVFKHAKIGKGYSNLPVTPVFTTTVRPTVWVGVGGYCLVNENGIRTGMQAFTLLELRYADGLLERVPGIARKANTPDTEGYILPVSSNTCVATPYLNTLISDPSSFTRNNCAPGYTGRAPVITINAGAYGSETSQAEAQSRAEAAWAALNTQAYANESGICELNYQSVAISRLSTLMKSGCTAPATGGRWTITVAAGAYTSSISQADADAQANTFANSLDTQANANTFGSCVSGQFYWVSLGSGQANYRVYVAQGIGYNFIVQGNIAPTYRPITKGQFLDMPVTAPYSFANLLHDSQSQGAYLVNYEIYKNGTQVSAGSVSIPNTQGMSPFLSLPPSAVGDLIFVKIF